LPKPRLLLGFFFLLFLLGSRLGRVFLGFHGRLGVLLGVFLFVLLVLCDGDAGGKQGCDQSSKQFLHLSVPGTVVDEDEPAIPICADERGPVTANGPQRVRLTQKKRPVTESGGSQSARPPLLCNNGLPRMGYRGQSTPTSQVRPGAGSKKR